jgi:outer membrane protein assembly factor BamB
MGSRQAETSWAALRGANEWRRYGYDLANTNTNAVEKTVSVTTAPYLRRAWETFNDNQSVTTPPPSGFVLEKALGLHFPSAVVGVVASPLIRDGTIYYIDVLGTVFARDAKSGSITDPARHWTTTLVDPDFDSAATPIAPDLYYTSLVVTDSHVWVRSAVYGRLHAVRRLGGSEVDFDPTTPAIDPYHVTPDRTFASSLGDPVVINTGKKYGGRELLITGQDVIVNDALVQGGQEGLLVALDITDPEHPVEVWQTPTIDRNPATGRPYATGVSAGSGLAVDLRRHWIFGGTGQNTSLPYEGYPDPALAPAGYIDRGDSLYALDYLTGQFVWSNQFHRGDVFNLNHPVSTGPNRPDGPRDADVLAPPVLFSVEDPHGRRQDLVGDGSKGGLFRVVDRDTGALVWERQISKPTGIGGIQAGAAYADGTVYVAGFEGLDDGFSDAQFGGKFFNAFFATFSAAFWADVEDTAADGDPSTGMRVKVYALDAATGRSKWDFGNGVDYVELHAGAALRHLSLANGLVFVTTSSGQLVALDAANGQVVFQDQTPDLNSVLNLGLGKPHHASMNGGTLISSGMVYVPYGAQNNPSGGLLAYEINQAPKARNDRAASTAHQAVTIQALANDQDANGDALRFVDVAGTPINTSDHQADEILLSEGRLEVVNPGDTLSASNAAYIKFVPAPGFVGRVLIPYTVEDIAPERIVNGTPQAGESNPTHRARSSSATIRIDVY